MNNIIVILDDNGSAVGAACKQDNDVVLVDNFGKQVQHVSLKTTIKEAKEILLRRIFHYIA